MRFVLNALSYIPVIRALMAMRRSELFPSGSRSLSLPAVSRR
jgi:hypothetical protein